MQVNDVGTCSQESPEPHRCIQECVRVGTHRVGAEDERIASGVEVNVATTLVPSLRRKQGEVNSQGAQTPLALTPRRNNGMVGDAQNSHP